MIPILFSLCLSAGGQWATVTAYADRGIMASGRRVYAGACAGPRSVPLGSLVRLGGKVYVLEDRVNKRFPARWDIWNSSRAWCLKHGAPKMKVTILRYGKGRR